MTERLAWTLIHFVWQGALIAFAYAIVRGLMSGAGPEKRYLLGCVTLALTMGAPVTTFISMDRPAVAERPVITRRTAASKATAMTPLKSLLYDSGLRRTHAASQEEVLQWVVWLWLAGAGIFWLRLIAGWVGTARMRSKLVRAAPDAWQGTLDRLRARIGVARPVRLLVSAVVKVPAVVGHLRPVVLMPAGVLTGLPPEQLEALLAHEIAHIRRHDYLVNVVQSVAEALLFYHPAVWWISGHIRAEREQCCDDIAVAATGDALTYARALVEFAAARPAATPSLAVSGGSLADRIARLLGERRRSPRAGSGVVVLATAAILIVAVGGLRGQGQERPNFDVVSVKENPTFRGIMGGMGVASPGTFRARNMPLRFLIRYSYDVNSFNIVGGPDWIDSAGFDIDAKTPVVPGQTRREENVAMLVMVQSVLEDRFKLKTHRETRDLPVYILTIAKSGLKMKPAPCDPAEPECVSRFQEARKTWPQPVTGAWGTMESFLVRLATLTNGKRTIIDKTELTGLWDNHMQWAYHPLPGTATNAGDAANEAKLGEPEEESIFTVLEKQLGLHLEAGRAPVEVLVVDHAEKPEPN